MTQNRYVRPSWCTVRPPSKQTLLHGPRFHPPLQKRTPTCPRFSPRDGGWIPERRPEPGFDSNRGCRRTSAAIRAASLLGSPPSQVCGRLDSSAPGNGRLQQLDLCYAPCVAALGEGGSGGAVIAYDVCHAGLNDAVGLPCAVPAAAPRIISLAALVSGRFPRVVISCVAGRLPHP